MSRLVLVSHTQASFFAKDYDQFSEMGRSSHASLRTTGCGKELNVTK